MRQLGEGARKVFDTATRLPCTPEVIRTLGQQRLGGNRRILDAGALIALDQTKMRLIRDREFECLDVILFRNSYNRTVGLPHSLWDASFGPLDIDRHRL